MEYLTLNHMLNTISAMGNYHICIHDVSGILKANPFSISHKYTIHSRRFCDLAKSTRKGFDMCMNCKNCANHRAIQRESFFAGLCAFGLYEAVKPVILEGKVACIIYLGYFVNELEMTVQKLENACHKSCTPFEEMLQEIANCECGTDPQKAMQLCELIDSYIRLLYDKYKDVDIRDESPYHWAVYNLKKYADDYYSQTFTLGNVCRLYFINEKYAGKLFKEQIGMSFHEYLNRIRLERAAAALGDKDEQIIDVASKCGFNNVTYFNRKFLEHYGMSPGQFRKSVRGRTGKSAE